MNLVSTGLKVTIFKVLSSAISFIGIAIFTRYIDASNLGLFFLFQSALGIAAIVTNFGISGAVEKRISERENPSEILSSALFLKTGLVVAAVAIVILVRERVVAYFGTDVVLLVIAGLALREIASLVIRVLSGEMKVATANFMKLLEQVAWLITGLLLVQYVTGGVALIYGLLIGYFTVVLGGIVIVSTSLGSVSKHAIRSLVKYGKFNAITVISGPIFNWVDVILIGYFLTNADTSYYVIAWKISQVTIIIVQAIGTTIFPQISEWDASRLTKKIEDLFDDVMVSGLYFMIPAVVGTIILREEILRYVFSAEYAVSTSILVVLMLGGIFNTVYIITSQFLHGTNRPDIAAKITVFALSLNVVMNVVLISQYGLIGAAVATSFSYLIMAVLYYRSLIRLYDISIPYLELTWVTVSAILMGIGTYSVRSLFKIESLPELLVVITLSAVVFFTISVAYKPLRFKCQKILVLIKPQAVRRYIKRD